MSHCFYRVFFLISSTTVVRADRCFAGGAHRGARHCLNLVLRRKCESAKIALKSTIRTFTSIASTLSKMLQTFFPCYTATGVLEKRSRIRENLHPVVRLLPRRLTRAAKRKSLSCRNRRSWNWLWPFLALKPKPSLTKMCWESRTLRAPTRHLSRFALWINDFGVTGNLYSTIYCVFYELTILGKEMVSTVFKDATCLDKKFDKLCLLETFGVCSQFASSRP